jgi:flagellar basal-body rod modification protein FlgD
VADIQEGNLVAGNNAVLTWDGKDDSGAVVPAGAYLYKIEVGEKAFTGTVVIAR